MTQQNVGTRAAAFARALVVLAVVVVGLPWLLVVAARARFAGGAPWHGVPAPADWSFEQIRSALTDRLTDQTIADIVIRISLVVAWVAILVLVATVVAEMVHMVRHHGMAMPDIRGLGVSQNVARVIATGLLVVVPMFASPSQAIARDGTRLVSEPRAAPTVEIAPDATTDGLHGDLTASSRREPSRPAATSAPMYAAPVTGGEYVVRSGDSVFGIAERIAGPHAADVAVYAEQIIDLNLGREMPDGRHFNNAAFLDVGWVLQLPDAGADARVDVAGDGVHVVERGESLWSIADEELGDPGRWPEIYEANEGQSFDDGRVLNDPDLILPGWALDVPNDDVTTADDAPVAELLVDDVPVDAPVAAIESADAAASAATPEPESESLADPVAVSDELAVGSDASARRDNVWDVAGSAPPAAAAAADTPGGPRGDERPAEAPEVLTLGRAAMLSAGVLTLLAVRRRNQLRRARPRTRLPAPSPRPSATERTLRAIDSGERFGRVDIATRAAAASLIAHGQRVLAVLVAADGELELRATGPVELPAPWEGAGASWHLAAATPIELLDAHQAVAPCPTLVQLGRDVADRDVYVDLEALEALEIGGTGAHADSIVAAISATLAGSVLAEVTTLVGLGVPDDAFLGHRLYSPVRDTQRAFEAAADAIGSTAASSSSTFELRARATSGETWEPAVVLVGASAGSVTPPSSRTGLAVVSASPVHGPSSRLAPDGDAWQLLPAGIRLFPIGLSPDDVSAIAELVTIIQPEPEPEPSPEQPGQVSDGGAVGAVSGAGDVSGDDDRTIVTDRVDGERHREAAGGPAVVEPSPGDGVAPPQYALLVTLLGSVEVVDAEGTAVPFERSKTRELVAWLATHRDRSTRSAARTALWELDVRDATFANVVSEARRSLARLVEPPDGEEWVARTMTDALPIHDLVRSDVDLVREALDAARVQPPAQAIATLTPAVELIRGMPFAGTSYLWPDAEGLTSNFVLLATTASTELAAHCLSIGDVEGVFSATSRGLQVLAGHEELIGLRMQAHARAGDLAGVRHEWETYERVINADPWSDGEPAPKLVELRRTLISPSR